MDTAGKETVSYRGRSVVVVFDLVVVSPTSHGLFLPSYMWSRPDS